MLIDWPKEKQEREQLLGSAIRRKTLASASVVALTPHVILVEGSQVDLVYLDGSRTEMVPDRHEYSLNLDGQDVRDGGMAPLQRAIEKLGGDMAEGMEKDLFKTLETASERTGRLFRGETVEAIVQEIIKGLEAMDFGFDESGKPEVVITLSPRAWEHVANFDSPELKQEVEKVVERKRREWVRRESHRRLVD